MNMRSVCVEELTPDEQTKIRSIFCGMAPALFDDLDKLKFSIKSLDNKRAAHGSDSSRDLVDEKSSIAEFNAVINALKELPTNVLMTEDAFQEKLLKLKESTDALKTKLELNGGWYALSLLKKVVGTITEGLFYYGIVLTYACGWGLISGGLFSMLTSNLIIGVMAAGMGAGYGAKVGRDRAEQWVPKVSDYISSCMFALPSAYRADKASSIDQTVQELQKRTAVTPGLS